MPLAAKWLDLVVGVDVHLEVVPGSPSPIPFPHPFVAPIYDPVAMLMAELSAAVGRAAAGPPGPGPVRIGGMPAGLTGDPVRLPIPHIFIPPGAMWGAVAPGSDAELVFGATGVSAGGGRPIRTGELAMSCSDPVRLPTTTVMSTGMPRPVMIGGPPTLDVGATPGGANTPPPRAAWDAAGPTDDGRARLPAALGRARDVVPKNACTFTGHPVNVVNGCVVTDAVDLALPGPIPLLLERTYSSNWCGRAGAFGPGWSHVLEQALWVEPHAVVVQTADGREIEFSTLGLRSGAPRVGTRLAHAMDALTLRCTDASRWTLTDRDGVEHRFTPVPGSAAPSRPSLARLVAVHAPDGRGLELRYDEHGRLAHVVDAAGRHATLESDRAGRVVRLWLAAPGDAAPSLVARYDYDDGGNLSAATDALGHTMRYEYDDGLLVREVDPLGVAFCYRYDATGRFARCVETWGLEPAGPDRATRPVVHHLLDYDRRGRKTIVTDGLGHVRCYDYDRAGMLGRTVDPMGGATVFERDADHRVIARVDALGTRVETNADAPGVEPGSDPGSDPGSERIAIARDGLGEIGAATMPDGGTWQWQRDGRGRVLRERDPRGGETRWTHDARDRTVRIETPDGDVRELAYDPAGNLARDRSGAGDAVHEYGALGRRTKTRTHDGEIVYTYDAETRLCAVARPDGETIAFDRDARGDIVAAIDVDGATTRFDRDALARITTITRPDGTRTAFAYDPAGRVVEAAHDGGPTARYAYRADGAMISAAQDGAEVRFDRDETGAIVGETTDDGEVRMLRDRAGRLLALEDSRGGRQEFERNPMGDVVRIWGHGGGHRFEATRVVDALGAEVDRRLPGGVRSYWWRDAAGRPTQHRIGPDQRQLRLRRYHWGPGARLDRLEDDGHPTLSCVHDGARLVRVDTDDGSSRPWPASSSASASRVEATQFDAAGHLVGVQTRDGVTAEYVYDALGRRVAAIVDGVVTRWLWAGDVPIVEWTDDDAIFWVFEPDGFAPAARLTAQGVHAIVTDHLGVPLCVLDDAGEVAWTRATEFLGDAPPTGDPALCPWRFPGHYRDAATGLHYVRWRYYDPTTTRFVSDDPLGLAAGFDPRAYVEDPFVQTDPRGLLPCGAAPAAGGNPLADLSLDPRPRDAGDLAPRGGAHRLRPPRIVAPVA